MSTLTTALASIFGVFFFADRADCVNNEPTSGCCRENEYHVRGCCQTSGATPKQPWALVLLASVGDTKVSYESA
jgi:hypothetical protein